MAKLTWLGEDLLHRTVTSEGVTVESAGPSFTVWRGVKFPKGEAVEVKDVATIAKAKANKFFKVDEEEKRGPGRPPKPKAEAVVEPEVTHDGDDKNEE